MHPAHPSDEEMATAAKRGDRMCLDGLVRRFTRPVYAICRQILRDSADAEDACQEVFLRLLKELSKHEEGRPFAPWLFKMTTNVAYNFTRSRRRRARHEAAAQPQEALTAPHDDIDRIRQAIENLPERYGLALLYKFREGLANADIAALLEVQPDAVRVILFRALAMVRQRLGSAEAKP
ncbi:MAG: RNA polymerase sigma factor [Planctomycetes bacterium]|nr:RNA polymerase sigma factor [Planctomycetota bacterium]